MAIECIMEERPKKSTSIEIVKPKKEPTEPILNLKELREIVGNQFKEIEMFGRSTTYIENDLMYIYNSDAAIHLRIASKKDLPEISIELPGMYDELLDMVKNPRDLTIKNKDGDVKVSPLILPEASYSLINSAIQINLNGKPFCYYLFYRNIMILPYVSFHLHYLNVVFEWLWPKILELSEIPDKIDLVKNIKIANRLIAMGVDYFIEKFRGNILGETFYINEKYKDPLDLKIVDTVHIDVPKMPYDQLNEHLKCPALIYLENPISQNPKNIAIEVKLYEFTLCYYLPEKDSFIFGNVLWHPNYIEYVMPKVWPLIVEKLELNETGGI